MGEQQKKTKGALLPSQWARKTPTLRQAAVEWGRGRGRDRRCRTRLCRRSCSNSHPTTRVPYPRHPVCFCWCHLISGRGFCRRIRELHPTALVMGAQLNLCNHDAFFARFVPTPPPSRSPRATSASMTLLFPTQASALRAVFCYSSLHKLLRSKQCFATVPIVQIFSQIPGPEVWLK